MKNKMIPLGALLTGLAVALGAFGAHGLKGRVEPYFLEVYQTGTQYFLIHSLGIMLYGFWFQLIAKQNQIKCWPALFFLVGSVFFTGSLYAITFTGIKAFGMITPIGGILYISAWLGFAKQASATPRDQ